MINSNNAQAWFNIMSIALSGCTIINGLIYVVFGDPENLAYAVVAVVINTKARLWWFR